MSFTGSSSSKPNFGQMKGILFRDRRVSGPSFTVSAPAGHRLFTRIAQTSAALSQSSAVALKTGEGDAWHAMGTMGGDGPAGHVQGGAWFYADAVTVYAKYRFSNKSWYFGDSRGAHATILDADEYDNGVLLTAKVDDAGFWSSNNDGPDGDFNDMVIEIWLTRGDAAADWAARVGVD